MIKSPLDGTEIVNFTSTTDNENSGSTTVQDIADLGRPYKVYTALLTQTGTDAPSVSILENTLGGGVVWSRYSAGVYIATSNAFSGIDTDPTLNKVITRSTDLFSNNYYLAVPYFEDISFYNINSAVFINRLANGNESLLDGLFHQLIEIKVYP
jgi:hypothetical protein